ncbi:MAG: lipoxygenase family protein [Zetaproteobacteria bacterium]|nr:lipoxygenase family protein [Zetaproteobacteria bacterium]
MNLLDKLFSKIPFCQHLSNTTLYQASGRLVFSDQPEKGLHNFYLEIWDKEAFHFEDKVVSGFSDHLGYFQLQWRPQKGRDYDNGLYLKVYEIDYRFKKNGRKRKIYHLIDTEAYQGNTGKGHYTFGDLYIPYWSYASQNPLPRVKIPDFGEPPCAFSNGRNAALLKPLVSIESARVKHRAAHLMDNLSPNVTDIQQDYPVNKTQQMEHTHPGSSRSDSYFVDRLLNGMIASILDEDPNDSHLRSVHIHWSRYEHAGPYLLPDTTITCKLEHQQLQLHSITLKSKGKESICYTPDGTQWQYAKKLARMSASLSAELDQHLVACHLNTEQYAIAAKRNLRLSPVRDLLLPHLKEVSMINHEADRILLGEQGLIAKLSGLSAQGIAKRIVDVMGSLDWYDWKPRKCLTPQHRYAKIAWRYYEFLDDYVRRFFTKHATEIEKHWYEIFYFSQDLTQHSVAYFMCPHLQQQKKVLGDQAFYQKYDWNERSRVELRQNLQATNKALSPVCTSMQQDEQGYENLISLCKYILFHSTFLHSWVNQLQYDDVGELDYAALGYLNNQDSLEILPEDGSETLWMSYLLSYTRYGFITQNENHDIYPTMPDMLQKSAADFEELGFDIHQINSRINI